MRPSTSRTGDGWDLLLLASFSAVAMTKSCGCGVEIPRRKCRCWGDLCPVDVSDAYCHTTHNSRSRGLSKHCAARSKGCLNSGKALRHPRSGTSHRADRPAIWGQHVCGWRRLLGLTAPRTLAPCVGDVSGTGRPPVCCAQMRTTGRSDQGAGYNGHHESINPSSMTLHGNSPANSTLWAENCLPPEFLQPLHSPPQCLRPPWQCYNGC